MPKQTLLVVDADPRNLRILEVALRKAGFAVVTAADGGEALRRLQRSPPDLLLCELSLPAQDGHSLCSAVRADERLAGLPVLLMNADRSAATRAKALEAGADDFLGKPLLIKELVTRVRMLLAQREQARYAQRGAPAALTGSVGDLGLVDLFTSLENWQKSATVVCEGEGRSARVWVRDGQVIDAEVEPLRGEAAFYRLLNWDSGAFRVEFGPVDRDPRTDAGTQALLMEGMRRIDEMGRVAEALPPSTVLAVDFPALAAHLADMPDELNGVLRLFDGHRTLREVVADSPLEDLSSVAVVQRLLADGVLVQAAAAAMKRKPSLEQWLGATPPPPEAPEAKAPSAQTSPAVSEAPAGVTAGGAASPAGRAGRGQVEVGGRRGAIELLRYPPLRGVRRDRLRREAEEARRALAAGKPVRLTHVVELPPTQEGADEMPEGMRRASLAVGDAARRFAPDVAVARFAPPDPDRAPHPAEPRFASEPRRTTDPPPAAAAAVLGRVPLALASIPDPISDAPTPPSGSQPLIIAAPAISPLATPAPADVPAGSPPPVARRRRFPRWATAAGVAAALLAAVVVVRLRQPRTDKKEALWLEAPAQSQAAVAAPASPPIPAIAAVAAPPAGADDYARALSAGESLLKHGRYRAAVAEFRKATALQPDSAPAQIALGDAFLEADLPRNALKPLQRAAELDPRSGRAQLLLGTAYQSLGHAREAVRAYKRYLELEPRGEFAGDVRAIVANLTR